MAIYLITLLLLTTTGTSLASEWTYRDEGHWSKTCKEGKSQSPVALSEDNTEIVHYEPLHFENYGRSYGSYLRNNGHSAEVRLDVTGRYVPEVYGGNLSHRYVLDHLHFHWQSEHTVDGYRFPLELHLVHFAREFQTLKAALPHPYGVAVFAILFDLSPDDNTEFAPLLEIIERLKDQVNQQFSLQEFVVKPFLPQDVAGYYRYNGSLTTPDCNEGILWTIFSNTIPISTRQAKEFEAIHSTDNSILTKNYRSIQPLNDRTVYLRVSPIRNNAMAISISYTVCFLTSFLIYIY